MNQMSDNELRKSFPSPPDTYGEIPCYWWEAGDLREEEIRAHVRDMHAKGICGTVMFNLYFAGDALSSRPAYFTKGWWDMVRVLADEEKKLGMEFWFSDWTGRKYWQDLIAEEIPEKPELRGYRLHLHEARSTQDERTLRLEMSQDEQPLDVAAYRKIEDSIDYKTRIDLNHEIDGKVITWTAPNTGWILTVIVSSPYELDYLDGKATDRWIELYFARFETELPGLLGSTVKGYIQDELFVLTGNILYSPTLIARIREARGIEITPYLIGLFHDIGKESEKIRCAYYEIMTDQLEDNLYGKLSRWHEERGLYYGTDATWGRLDMLQQTFHYGDFFRMMRHFHVTGNEDPKYSAPGGRRFIDDKLSSSIAHLYGRDQVMVDCYWLSGWGVTQEENMAWTNENYAYGMTCYNRHGVNYTLMGGWKEWVPPATFFYQPYWQQWKTFSDYVKRLSFILRQGVHAADVAILYPITTIHAGWSSGSQFSTMADFSARTTFSLARLVYDCGMDFDFIDFTSVEKADVIDGRLAVAGMSYKVLLLPPLSAIRSKTMEKVEELYENGGVVIAYNSLPSASAEEGRGDPRVAAFNNKVFGVGSNQEHRVKCAFMPERIKYSVHQNRNDRGGRAFLVPGDDSLITEIIDIEIDLDFRVEEGTDIFHADQGEPICTVMGPNRRKRHGVFHTHQKSGSTDIYFIYNSKEHDADLELILGVAGKPEIWDAGSGAIFPHFRFEILDGKTRIRTKMEKFQGLLFILTPYDGSPQIVEDNLGIIEKVTPDKNGVRIAAYDGRAGKKKVHVRYENDNFIGETRMKMGPEALRLTGGWTFELKPTMDNPRGDFRYPASTELIGAEARRVKYSTENSRDGLSLGWEKPGFEDASWAEYNYSHGPYFWNLSFQDGQEPVDLVPDIENDDLSFQKSYRSKAGDVGWKQYVFSQLFGSRDRQVHDSQSSLPFMEGVADDFIVLKERDGGGEVENYFYTSLVVSSEMSMFVDFGTHELVAEGPHDQKVLKKTVFPRTMWLNGKRIIHMPEGGPVDIESIQLAKGANTLVLKIVQVGGEKISTYVDLRGLKERPEPDVRVPRLRWFQEDNNIQYDVKPRGESVGWYRFDAPAGTESMALDMVAESIRCFVDGRELPVADGKVEIDTPGDDISKVALRVAHRDGRYAGAAMNLPVKFDTRKTAIELGNWEEYALESYSGGAVYQNAFTLEKIHIDGKVILNLGDVMVAATVSVNGKPAGTKIAGPYIFDITGLVNEGGNNVEVFVCNTLANHYNVDFPSQVVYHNQTISGLLGPVTVEFAPRVELIASPVAGS